MKKQRSEFDINKYKEEFEKCCPEFFMKNEMHYFNFFYCPVSIAQADVKEHIIEEYESMELLILQLYDSGLHSKEQISEVTGLDEKLVSRILHTEINAYAHIDKNTGELTATGIKTLEENSNIQNNNMIIHHVVYDVKRELQIEAVTGTVINIRCEQKKEHLFKIYPSKYDHIIPRDSIVMDAEITKEIRERLQEYKHRDILNDGDTIKEINNIKTHEIRYIRAFLAKFHGLPHPMIVLRGWDNDKENNSIKIIYMPTAISKSTQLYLEEQGVSLDKYLVREDEFFNYLIENINKFEFNTNINVEEVEEEEIIEAEAILKQSIDELIGKAEDIYEPEN